MKTYKIKNLKKNDQKLGILNLKTGSFVPKTCPVVIVVEKKILEGAIEKNKFFLTAYNQSITM